MPDTGSREGVSLTAQCEAGAVSIFTRDKLYYVE